MFHEPTETIFDLTRRMQGMVCELSRLTHSPALDRERIAEANLMLDHMEKTLDALGDTLMLEEYGLLSKG